MSLKDEITLLRRELEVAERLDASEIEASLPASGFTCARCAQCCCGAGGDNTVALFPGEVRRIMAATGLAWPDVATPPETADYDSAGRRHAFEWVLKKKPDGDCIFLDGSACRIYDARPHICRTYPFSFNGQELEAYECEGLHPAVRCAVGLSGLAVALKERYVTELRETLRLLENFEPFEPGQPSDSDLVVVHDSEGARIVSRLPNDKYEDTE